MRIAAVYYGIQLLLLLGGTLAAELIRNAGSDLSLERLWRTLLVALLLFYSFLCMRTAICGKGFEERREAEPKNGVVAKYAARAGLHMLLIGMACIAIGIFISSLTESQLVAVLLSMVVLAVASISHYLASLISVPWLRTFLSYFAIGGRYSYLAGGQFDFSAILYYLSISGVFLLLTIRVFERKRWH